MLFKDIIAGFMLVGLLYVIVLIAGILYKPLY